MIFSLPVLQASQSHMPNEAVILHRPARLVDACHCQLPRLEHKYALPGLACKLSDTSQAYSTSLGLYPWHITDKYQLI